MEQMRNSDMTQLDFDKPCHVHFIGIGGISMSGLPEILMDRGFTVSGSDSTPSDLTDRLIEHGATVYFSQVADNIRPDIDLVVYSAAIHEDNEELMEVRAQNIPALSRAELLGQLMNNYETPIAVAGTHGKTTTTSMIAHILLEADTDPTISVGGVLQAIGGNVRIGSDKYFLMEACEYTNSFLHFNPKVAIILNIDEDHLDFFKDLADIRHSFHEFAGRLPADGTLIIGGEIPYLKAITQGLKCKIVTFGTNPVDDYYANDFTYESDGYANYHFYRKGEDMGRVSLSVTGRHNITNSVAAMAAADVLGIPLSVAQRGLLSFHGTTRRFEYKGTVDGITIVDDYAHHPTEIRATLAMARLVDHDDVWCIFQPHTYTRTKALFDEFVEVLSGADHIILPDIYAARETDDLGVSSELLCEALKKRGVDAYYLGDFSGIENFVLDHCQKNDLLITMGAGNVVKIADDLCGR